jgi:hypothetical protein
MKKKVYEYMEYKGKMYRVELVHLECIGGCGRVFGPFPMEPGVKGEIECLTCRIKRVVNCQAKQGC